MSSSKSQIQAVPAAVPTNTVTTVLALLLGWAIPGAGHLFLKRPLRAVSFFAIVTLSLVVGCALEGRLPMPIDEQPLSKPATIAGVGTGVAYFVLRGIGYEGNILAAGYEYGSAFILTAGLMNLMLVLDVWDIARGQKE